MLKQLRIISLSILLLLVSVLHTGCSSRKSDNTLRIMDQLDVRTLDSVKATDIYSRNLITNFSEGLYTYGKNGEIILGMAASEPKQNGLTYTFKLRDAKWSDGQTVTAEDFAFAWRRCLDPEVLCENVRLFEVIKGAKEYRAGKSKDIAGIKVLDSKTLVVTFEHPVPYLKHLFSLTPFMPQRRDIVEKYGNQFATTAETMVYNGPFRLAEFNPGAKYELIRNEEYWDKENVRLDGVEVFVIKDENSADNLYKIDQLDYIILSPQQVDAFRSHADFKTVQVPWPLYLILNHRKAKFQNPHIHKAISLALNRSDLTDKIKQDGSKPMLDLITDEINASQSDRKFRDLFPAINTKMDIHEAKLAWDNWLKELGNSRELNQMVLITADAPECKRNVEWLQEQLRANLGIEIKIECLPLKVWLDKGKKGEFDLMAMAWNADFSHPDTFLDMFCSNQDLNYGKWHSEEYDKLIELARGTTNPKKRDELLYKAERLLCTRGIIPLSSKTRCLLVKPRVKDLVLLQFGAHIFLKYASLDDSANSDRL